MVRCGIACRTIEHEHGVVLHTTHKIETAGYKVYWRLTDRPQWQWSESTTDAEHTLENVVIDNYVFGVASVAEGGFESPVVFPGPIGGFAPAAWTDRTAGDD